MASRTTFTPSEADRIRSLLDKARRSDRQAQKALRATLRRIGFHISDFDTSGAGFTRADFNDLVHRGVVTVVDDETPAPGDLQRSVPAVTKEAPTPEFNRDTHSPGVDIPQIALALSAAHAQRPDTSLPPTPGLYSFHGDAATWQSLGLGDPPDDRPLYIGKAEDSIAKRVGGTHLRTGRTGQSTVRRTFAALLVEDLDLRARPRDAARMDRSANFGLESDGDKRLTAWMLEHLQIATCPLLGVGEIKRVEASVVQALVPPLNLDGARTPWRTVVADARARMVAQAGGSRRSAVDSRPL